MRLRPLSLSCSMLLALTVSCDSDADDLGVAAECSKDGDCNQDIEPPLTCLKSFKGGYCGLSGCDGNSDCPEASICVTHTDGVNYCFRECAEKSECNENRDGDNEANCTANIVRVDGGSEKACVPPSAGS